MTRALLVRGLIAGLVAGIAAALFFYFSGTSLMQAATAIEEAGHGHGDDHEHDLVSGAVQATLGLLVAAATYGVAVGGLFALLFALVYGRFGPGQPRTYSAVLAAGAFVVLTAVPFAAYPANPPGVGGGDTVDARTAMYFVFLAISLAAAGLALYAAARLRRDRDGWYSGVGATAAYLVVVATVGVLMPRYAQVGEFPGDLLWDFRVVALGGLVVFWLVLGVTFGALAQRLLSTGDRRAHPAHA